MVNTLQKPLRLWPGMAAAVLLLLARFVLPVVNPDAILFAILGAMACTVAIIVWWAFFSRAAGIERWGALVVAAAAMLATSRLLDKSIATGMMGMMFLFLAPPLVAVAFVAWAVATSRLSTGVRRATMVVSLALASGAWALIKTGGFNSSLHNDLAWRWAKTPEDRLLEKADLPPAPAAPAAAVPVAASVPAATPAKVSEERPGVQEVKAQPVALTRTPAEPVETQAVWPGFRGPRRDSIVKGVRINTDWSATPPVELWHRAIGPGWSSFAVGGDLIYTQEQRGEDEVVTCYNAVTGKPVWAHRDVARFWESNAGAGPRATPTLSGGRVYTFGATGILNALDARDGAVAWSRNAASDTGTKLPGWGFASSPLVLRDMVVVGVGGELAAYDAATGAPRWTGPAGGDSYSSPHLATIDGVEQILLMSATGATSVTPADGKLLWKYEWPSTTRIMQPAVTADGDVVMTVGDAMGGGGIRRIGVEHSGTGWSTAERWDSRGLKPSFNDFVVYEGHIYGFDGGILACVDAKDGKRLWKGGRYGAGQLVLLGDQGVLLVISEEGELALVKAAPDQFTELARFPALDGKTWNHPVLAGDRLLVRNGSEMAAFRLALAR